jgi:hypothetical protein
MLVAFYLVSATPSTTICLNSAIFLASTPSVYSLRWGGPHLVVGLGDWPPAICPPYRPSDVRSVKKARKHWNPSRMTPWQNSPATFTAHTSRTFVANGW